MTVFGYDFDFLDEQVELELASLEREGAIYTDMWIEHLQDFRHVRIAFTEAEREEYVRSLWAYELFLRADSPAFASEVMEIPRDVAQRADAYSMQTINGEHFEAPYHCIAGFIGEELEILTCSPPESRYEILVENGKAGLIMTLKRAVDAITPSIRRFNKREKGLKPWPISREDDVRDLLYVMLRASIADIRTEEPVPSRGETHKYVDIFSELAGLFVEIKWIHRAKSWKQILKQINDDIQSYIKHPSCNILAFLVIDAAKDIPDPALIERQLSGLQVIAEKKVEVLVFIREP
jgi:REase_DpnII-MboI